ncbi:DUF5987 family protein [Longispora sp. K20-0274]|uniref:DUF5987 family protein n=1 Tax=Longispora sp. K20-0274 TaxID=3088255 RepID=UPI00399AB7A3
MQPGAPEGNETKIMTLEAFADTIVPGEKRWPDDRAVAGVSVGGGAVASGAVTLLEDPAGGLAEALDGIVFGLNAYAEGFAAEHGVALDESVPPFVALSYEHRTALVAHLTAPGHPEKALWVGVTLFCNMAFDSAAHISTHDALAEGHPGLLTIGYSRPDPDGLWRFPRFSYGRPLSSLHPNTTSTGSPA